MLPSWCTIPACSRYRRATGTKEQLYSICPPFDQPEGGVQLGAQRAQQAPPCALPFQQIWVMQQPQGRGTQVSVLGCCRGSELHAGLHTRGQQRRRGSHWGTPTTLHSYDVSWGP